MLFDITPVAYQEDGAQLAERFADLPGMVFLDGRSGRAPGAGWDLIAALPEHILRISDYEFDAHRWFDAIDAALSAGEYTPAPDGWPFAPGAVGFLDYDSAARLHGVVKSNEQPATVGLYRAVVVQDHSRQQAMLVCDIRCPADTRDTLLTRLSSDACPAALWPAARLLAPFAPEISDSQYIDAIDRIQGWLRAGDCYQVNFAHRFHTQLIGHPWRAYRSLRAAVRGSYAAYLALTPGHTVLSLSPERFISVENGAVITQPIKGTAPRSPDPEIDRAAAQALSQSPKDHAENVMITDLLRNDLGQWCMPGSVQTEELCVLRSYSNVHHLVSTVRGQLRPGIHAGALLAGCAPGGSITGAPKRRAIEIIAELESAPRGVYCGSVFTLTRDGTLHSSITIRTVEAIGSDLYCWGGGGITVDSVAENEYQETLDKVEALLKALPTQ
ncbi:MAG: anthranilate synthase component I family protein [Halieaceae bacterium]|nr:anthranilate synthase component I family protein [Halieaceae bacterium]